MLNKYFMKKAILLVILIVFIIFGCNNRKDILKNEVIIIPEGKYIMGDNYNKGYPFERPPHPVYVDTFCIAKYEVTNNEYCQFLNLDSNNLFIQSSKTNYMICRKSTQESYPFEYIYMDNAPFNDFNNQITYNGKRFIPNKGYENHPVVNVTWYGAIAFCNWKSRIEGKEILYDENNNIDITKNGYRLPTESEWEKAARGGIIENYYPWKSYGNDYLTHVNKKKANYKIIDDYRYLNKLLDKITGRTSPVGSYMPNGYGLNDMAGNVWEWCNDEFDRNYYQKSSKTNPLGPDIKDSDNFKKVIRGGSWKSSAVNLRCSARYWADKRAVKSDVGFRYVRRP